MPIISVKDNNIKKTTTTATTKRQKRARGNRRYSERVRTK